LARTESKVLRQAAQVDELAADSLLIRRTTTMLPPMIPLSAVPVTSQLDPVKQRPEIPPVVPVQPSSNESTIDLRKRNPEQTAIMLREEQRRQHERQRGKGHQDVQDEPLAVPGDSLNADNTVPVVALMDDEPRQGIWVDVEV